MDSTNVDGKIRLNCAGITRQPIEFVDDLDFQKALAKDFEVLPLFEKKAYDYNRVRHYSLLTNDLLNCRWRQLMSRVGEEQIKKTLKMFPTDDDFHFHNCCIRYLPSLSIKNMPPQRLTLATGPGVDKFGLIPIPNDMQMRVSQCRKKHSGKTKKIP